METKKIVILTQYFPPEMGAPQSRLFETAKGLKELGWDVFVITAMPNYPSGKISENYKGRLFYNEKIDDINVFRTWLFASNSKKSMPRILSMLSFSILSLFSVLKIKKFKPDFILTESPPLTLGLSGMIISKIVGAKHLINVSDIWPLSAFELDAISNEGYLYKMLVKVEQFLYKKSYASIGQSNQIVNHLNVNGAKRSWLYRNGVNSSRFKQPMDFEERKPIRIVYAGLLGVAQGLFDIVKNIDLLDGRLELHIYGEGAEKKEIIEFLNCNPKKGVFINESVKRDKVPDMLSQHHITLIPLRKPIYGAVPSKIYEAMAAGLPIIFAGGGEGAEIIERYELGWICKPSDFSQLNSILITILNTDLELILKKRKNCQFAGQKIFDREIQINKLNELLKA